MLLRGEIGEIKAYSISLTGYIEEMMDGRIEMDSSCYLTPGIKQKCHGLLVIRHTVAFPFHFGV